MMEQMWGNMSVDLKKKKKMKAAAIETLDGSS